MFNYQKSANTAARLLANFGSDATLKTVTEGTYNTATGSVTNTETDTTVKQCNFAINDGNRYFVDNVQANDRYALISPSVAAIDPSDKLVIDGVTWNIVNSKVLKPASTVVLFICHIRK